MQNQLKYCGCSNLHSSLVESGGLRTKVDFELSLDLACRVVDIGHMWWLGLAADLAPARVSPMILRAAREQRGKEHHSSLTS